jgi:acyl-CoA thioester hydrolase
MTSRWDDVTAHVEHRVTFSETDALGFVHHANSAVWFERAREAWFRRHSVPALELYLRGWYFAVRQLNVRYERFVGYEDVLSIRVALTKVGRVAADFHYRVDNLTRGWLALRGHTNLVAVEDKGRNEPPVLGRIRIDREPLQKLLVNVDEFFEAPTGAWQPPRWDPEGPAL